MTAVPELAEYLQRKAAQKWEVENTIPAGRCALCPASHVLCVFTAGSLFCVRPDCSNPHHRTAGGAR